MILLLDLDGTLIDSFSRHWLLLEELLQKYASGARLQVGKYRESKRSGKNNYQYLVEDLNLPEELALRICDEWIQHIEDSDWLSHDTLYSDTRKFLECVKSHGDQVIYLSSRQNATGAREEIDRLGIGKFASEVIIVNKKAEYTTKAEYISHILRGEGNSSLQQLDNRDIIMIGDTEDDYNAALANQAPYFILNRGFRSSEYLAKIGVKESFAGLMEVSRKIYE